MRSKLNRPIGEPARRFSSQRLTLPAAAIRAEVAKKAHPTTSRHRVLRRDKQMRCTRFRPVGQLAFVDAQAIGVLGLYFVRCCQKATSKCVRGGRAAWRCRYGASAMQCFATFVTSSATSSVDSGGADVVSVPWKTFLLRCRQHQSSCSESCVCWWYSSFGCHWLWSRGDD